MNLSIKIIGIGGIGTHLCQSLCRYLNYSDKSMFKNCQVVLVDNDKFDESNESRQLCVVKHQNKAETLHDKLSIKYPRISFGFYPLRIRENNVGTIIDENDVVFVCTDNHKSRNVINERCKKLKDITLISGGNELTDGQVQVFVRRNGIDLTPSITTYHPEIKDADDDEYDHPSCQQIVEHEPQVIWMNEMIAVVMGCVFFNLFDKRGNTSEKYSDIYVDINLLKMATYLYPVGNE